jgi:outer membrane murein-binding lipoprotein Lpp
MHQLTTVISLILLSLALAGCGKSQEQKEAEADAKFNKLNDAYQERLRQSYSRFAPQKDKHGK